MTETRSTRSLILVALTVTLMGSVVVVGTIASQPSPCCFGKRPYVTLYNRPLSRVDAVLAEGDGQAFAALAQDPLLARPGVVAPHEYAYRAQRPVWAYLDWIASLGQPNMTGWALAALTVLSCGAAGLVVALLLRQRGASPWWSLLVPLVGLQTLREFTPELLALALFGAGVLFWQRDRNALAVAAFALSALTRETVLVGVIGLAGFEWARSARGAAASTRRIMPLLFPFAVYGAWVATLRLRLGNLPFTNSQGRIGIPGAGLISSVEQSRAPLGIVVWSLAALAICVAAVTFSRRDVLTWVAVANLMLASTFGDTLWLGNAGFARTLLPLYILGTTAVVGGLRAAPAPPDTPASARDDAAVITPGREPALATRIGDPY